MSAVSGQTGSVDCPVNTGQIQLRRDTRYQTPCSRHHDMAVTSIILAIIIIIMSLSSQRDPAKYAQVRSTVPEQWHLFGKPGTA